MPFVRRPLGAQPVSDFRVDEAGNRAEEGNRAQGEVAARVEARLPRPAGVSLLRRRVRVMGAGDERGRPRPRTPNRRSTRVSPSGPRSE